MELWVAELAISFQQSFIYRLVLINVVQNSNNVKNTNYRKLPLNETESEVLKLLMAEGGRGQKKLHKT